MTALIFVGAIIWGSLSGQFLIQTAASLIIASISLVALVFSKVPKAINAMASAVTFVQAIIYAALFCAGNWIASGYIDFSSWNASSIAFLTAFLATIIPMARQVPGKILLARLTAWAPHFAQAAIGRPAAERVALARKFQASPTMETLYLPRTIADRR